MIIKLMSDIHLEGNHSYRPPITDSDKDTILVLAGDICEFKRIKMLVDFLNEMSRFLMIIYVPGNHEYYRGHLPNSLDKIRNATSHITNLHILDNQSIVYNGVKFIGSTCWTSIKNADPIEMVFIAMELNDYKYIRVNNYRLLVPMNTVRMHETAVKYIQKELKSGECAVNVVITHHAPCVLSISDYHRQTSKINYAYYTDLTELMYEYKPALWLHGHVHNSFNYEMYDTNIAANPRGYGSDTSLHENSSYDEDLRFTINDL